jgi:hypothetical protein
VSPFNTRTINTITYPDALYISPNSNFIKTSQNYKSSTPTIRPRVPYTLAKPHNPPNQIARMCWQREYRLDCGHFEYGNYHYCKLNQEKLKDPKSCPSWHFKPTISASACGSQCCSAKYS